MRFGSELGVLFRGPVSLSDQMPKREPLTKLFHKEVFLCLTSQKFVDIYFRYS